MSLPSNFLFFSLAVKLAGIRLLSTSLIMIKPVRNPEEFSHTQSSSFLYFAINVLKASHPHPSPLILTLSCQSPTLCEGYVVISRLSAGTWPHVQPPQIFTSTLDYLAALFIDFPWMYLPKYPNIFRWRVFCFK